MTTLHWNRGLTIDATTQDRVSLSAWLLSKLSRVTTSNRFIAQIDGLRFLAIISVVLLHLSTAAKRNLAEPVAAASGADWLAWAINHGGIGVQVFFAISGFILALPFALHYLDGRRAVGLQDYFLRRVTRLEPPYIITLVLLFGLHLALHTPNGPGLGHLLASMFYVHNIAYGEISRVNGVAWSLEVEVQFYILAPVIATAFAISSARLRRGILVAAIVAFAFVKGQFDDQLNQWHLSLSLPAYLHCFLIGFLFADIYVASWKQAPALGSRWWDVAGFIALLGIFPAGQSVNWSVAGLNGNVIVVLIMLVSTLVLFASVFKGRLFKAMFTNRWIATIGGMCYTIYLLHYPITLMAMKFTRSLSMGDSYWANILVQSAIILPLIFAGSAVFFILVERPCMIKDWPAQLWSRLRGQPRRIALPA